MSGGGIGEPELVPVLDRHRFDEAALARHLRGRLPGFDGPVEVRQFQGGQSNPTFHLRTGAGDYVLRKKPPGKLLPPAHEVEREYRVLRALAGSGVPVPPVRLLCEDASVVGTAFFVMDHVPGRVFPDRVMTAGAPAERAAVYEDMARVLAALHRVDWRAAGLEGFGKPEGYMARQVALWTRQWEAARVEEMPEMDRLAAWLPGHLPADEEATVAHGDFRLGNLIVHPTEPRIAAVLDWELATLGDPLMDLGNTLAYWVQADDDFLAQATRRQPTHLQGMLSRREVVDYYCGKMGFDAQDVTFHEVYGLFRLSAIAQQIYYRYHHGQTRNPAFKRFWVFVHYLHWRCHRLMAKSAA